MTHGHVTYDHVTYGHVTYGHVTYGHVTYDHVTYGHVTYGHVTYGHVTYGHAFSSLLVLTRLLFCFFSASFGPLCVPLLTASDFPFSFPFPFVESPRLSKLRAVTPPFVAHVFSGMQSGVFIVMEIMYAPRFWGHT